MQLTHIKQLTGTLVLKTGLHIGAGDTEMRIGGTDNPVVKNPLDRLAVIRSRFPVLVSHLTPQSRRLQHFHRRAMAHDFQHQLLIDGIGNLQHVAPILVEAAALLRMPVFCGDPTRTLSAEAQLCPLQI